MLENQESIVSWADSAFGNPDPMSPRLALRVLEEVVELCHVAGASNEDICRIFGRACTKSKEGWPRNSWGLQDDAHPEPEKVPAEAADVLITLLVLAGRRGFDLDSEVQKKMEKNRGRTWKPFGDGTGQHIRRTETPE